MLLILAGAITVSLTAEIFWEGLKAGLVTFGGAFTVIPYLHDVAVQPPAEEGPVDEASEDVCLVPDEVDERLD